MVDVSQSGENQHHKLELHSVHGLEDRPISVPEVGRGPRRGTLPSARIGSPSALADFWHRTPSAVLLWDGEHYETGVPGPGQKL